MDHSYFCWAIHVNATFAVLSVSMEDHIYIQSNNIHPMNYTQFPVDVVTYYAYINTAQYFLFIFATYLCNVYL